MIKKKKKSIDLHEAVDCRYNELINNKYPIRIPKK